METETKQEMNVSTAADAEFMHMLEKEDPERYARLMKNIRQSNPMLRKAEDQALTNFMLGLPTGQWRFQVIAGPPALALFVPDWYACKHGGASSDKSGRPRKFKTNADRQAAYRQRQVRTVTKPMLQPA